MDNVKGYNALHPTMKNLFLKIYRKHLSSMGKEAREKHTIDKIVEIKVNQSESCFEVYYKYGDWYKYYPNGTWG